MKLTKGISAIAIVVAAGLGATAAMAQVTVGISLSTTGPAAALGVPAANMVSLLPTEIGGQKLRIILLDDAGDAGRATTNARRFVTEEKADIILGSSITPTSTSIGNVALESGTPHIAVAPVALPPDRMKVTFTTLQMPPLLSTPKFNHMQSKGVKTLAMIGFSDSWGDLWVAMYKRFGEPLGIKMIADERYGRSDSTVTGQVLKVIAQNPDAVLIAASGTGAALPQIALRERGYKGLIYQTAGAVSTDMLRLAGKSAEGLFASTSPAMFPEIIADKPMQAEAEKYVKLYEDKFGANTRNQFAPNVYDAFKVMERVIPVAIKSGAKPGTPEFRAALIKAMETEKEIVGAHGYYNFTPTDHAGLDSRAVIMVTVKDGKWTKAD
jgi:branched-chain amino acid transport system substrate-binding protein